MDLIRAIPALFESKALDRGKASPIKVIYHGICRLGYPSWRLCTIALVTINLKWFKNPDWKTIFIDLLTIRNKRKKIFVVNECMHVSDSFKLLLGQSSCIWIIPLSYWNSERKLNISILIYSSVASNFGRFYDIC